MFLIILRPPHSIQRHTNRLTNTWKIMQTLELKVPDPSQQPCSETTDRFFVQNAGQRCIPRNNNNFIHAHLLPNITESSVLYKPYV